jgi:hypothetical protein
MAVMTLVEAGRNDVSESMLSANIENGKLKRTFVFGVGAQAQLPQASIPASGIFRAPTPQDLIDTIQAVIGTTYDTPQPPNAQNGQLNRLLPMCDPQIPYWYAQSIDSLQGVGAGAPAVNVANLQLTYIASNSPFTFLIYQTYSITITLAMVPYPVFKDAYVPIGSSLWYPRQAVLVGGEPSQISFPFAREWQRFATYDSEPINDYVVSNVGNSVFREANVPPAGLNGTPFSGPPRIYLPNDIVTFKWYGVPFRYITSPNSNIRRYRGCINQFSFWETPTGTSHVFPAGSLLFLTYKPTIYTPPIALTSPLTPALPPNVMPQKLVNIEFTCLHTDRQVSGNPITPWNPNWLTLGHNILPSFSDRLWHYASAQPTPPADPSNNQLWFPSFLSFPIELLWTDPDI